VDGPSPGRRLGRRPAGAAERTRRAIVRAATRLFAERGFGAVSVRDIGQEAGINHGLVRHHFGSKDGVWRAVVEAADAEYVSAMRPVLAKADADEDPQAAVATIVRGLVSVSSMHPEIVRLLVQEGARGGERLDHILDRVGPLRRAVGPIFARLRRRGLLEQFEEDEFFLVYKGTFILRFRDGSEVVLNEGEFYVGPLGVEHLPIAPQEC